jgi:hypothetical protein
MNLRLTIRQVMGCYLALALLMVPLLGLMHGIVHGLSHAPGYAQARVFDSEPVLSQAAAADAAGWSEKLFAAHGKVADCVVFDQLCQAQAFHSLPLQALPTMLPSFVLVTLAGDFIARWAALFQARGPPSAR